MAIVSYRLDELHIPSFVAPTMYKGPTYKKHPVIGSLQRLKKPYQVPNFQLFI